MRGFPSWFHIPLDDWIDRVADWVTTEGAVIFGTISDALFILLLRVEQFLLWLLWPVVKQRVLSLSSTLKH